jgi:hypothetical protein
MECSAPTRHCKRVMLFIPGSHSPGAHFVRLPSQPNGATSRDMMTRDSEQQTSKGSLAETLSRQGIEASAPPRLCESVVRFIPRSHSPDAQFGMLPSQPNDATSRDIVTRDSESLAETLSRKGMECSAPRRLCERVMLIIPGSHSPVAQFRLSVTLLQS